MFRANNSQAEIIGLFCFLQDATVSFKELELLTS